MTSVLIKVLSQMTNDYSTGCGLVEYLSFMNGCENIGPWGLLNACFPVAHLINVLACGLHSFWPTGH